MPRSPSLGVCCFDGFVCALRLLWCAAEAATEADHCPIEPDGKEIRPDPYPLPAGYVWSVVDISDGTQVCGRVLLTRRSCGAGRDGKEALTDPTSRPVLLARKGGEFCAVSLQRRM